MTFRTKAELLTAKERNYEAFLKAVAGIRNAQVDSEPEPVSEDWTLKDVVAHVAYWETSLAKALLTLLLEDAPFPYFDSYDRINAFSTVLRRKHSLTEVLAELKTAHSDVTAIIEELVTDAMLDQRVPIAYPSRVEHRALSKVFTSYIEHYVEHAAQIRG